MDKISRIKIRKVSREDVNTIVALTRETIRKVNIRDYTKKQIAVWSSKHTAKRYLLRIDDKSIIRIVAVSGEKIVGCASLKLKDNELCGFYIKHNLHGKGIGSKLLKHIESCARKNGLDQIKLYSTLTAVKFYERYGYTKVRRMTHLFDTVLVPCVLMKKKL